MHTENDTDEEFSEEYSDIGAEDDFDFDLSWDDIESYEGMDDAEDEGYG